MCLAHSSMVGATKQQQHGCGSVMARHQETLCLYASLGHFIRVLCHFIKAALEDEHMHRLEDAGNSIAFIRNPVATKELEMWDGA